MTTFDSTSVPLPTLEDSMIATRSHDLATRHIHAQISTLAKGLFKLKGGTKRDWEAYGFRQTLDHEHGDLLEEIPDSDEWRNYPPIMDEVDLKNQFAQWVPGYYDTPWVKIYRSFRDFLSSSDTPLPWDVWMHDDWDTEGDHTLTDAELEVKFPDHLKMYKDGFRDNSLQREKRETFADYLVNDCDVDNDQVEEEGYEINWYVVTEWAQAQLEKYGQIVADVGGLCLWGRITGFQLPESDSCWLSIAREELTEELEHERYRRERSQPNH